MPPNIFIYPFIFLTLFYGISGKTKTGPTHGKVVVCYLTWSSFHREGFGKFVLSDLDPSLCTHVIYAYANIEENSTLITNRDSELESFLKLENDVGYRALLAMKTNYPHLKVLIAVGGWSENPSKYSNIAASPSLRALFIQNVLDFLDHNKLDGMDLFWKYPTFGNDNLDEKANFVALIKELKEAFTPKKYILTTVIGGSKYIMDNAYDFPQLNQYVDLLNVMAYDYHDYVDGIFGVNAPLQGLNDDDVMSIEYTIKYLLSHGVSPDKVVLGLPLHGKSYILEDPKTENIKIGRTVTKSQAFSGPYTTFPGFLAYNEICMELTKNESKWTQHWHEQSSTPYIRSGERVISYENTRSIAAKVKTAMEYNLTGVMVWALDLDDFKGLCNRERDNVSVSSSTLPFFVDRFSQIAGIPTVQRLLKNLNLPDAQTLRNLSISTEKNQNYPMMRAIDESLNLAIEEKTIMTELITFMHEKAKDRINIATHKPTPIMCYFCFV